MKNLSISLLLFLATSVVCVSTYAQGLIYVGDTIMLGLPVGENTRFDNVYFIAEYGDENTFELWDYYAGAKVDSIHNLSKFYTITRIIPKDRPYEDKDVQGVMAFSGEVILKITNCAKENMHLFVMMEKAFKYGETRKITDAPLKQSLSTRDGRVVSLGDTVTIGENTGDGRYEWIYQTSGPYSRSHWLDQLQYNFSGKKFKIVRLIDGKRSFKDPEYDELLNADQTGNSIAKMVSLDNKNFVFADLDNAFSSEECISSQKKEPQKLTLKDGKTITEGDTITIGKCNEEGGYQTLFFKEGNTYFGNPSSSELSCQNYIVTRLIAANNLKKDWETQNLDLDYIGYGYNYQDDIAKIKSVNTKMELFVPLNAGFLVGEIFQGANCPASAKEKIVELTFKDAFIAFAKLSKLNLDALTNDYLLVDKEYSKKNEFDKREIFQKTKERIQQSNVSEITNKTYSILIRKELKEYDFTRGGFGLSNRVDFEDNAYSFGSEKQHRAFNIGNYDNITYEYSKYFTFNLLNYQKFLFFKMDAQQANQFLKSRGNSRTVWVKYDFKIDTSIPSSQSKEDYILPIKILKVTISENRNQTRVIGVVN